MGFRAVVASNSAKLSPTELRVVDVLFGVGTSQSTAAEIAYQAGTHESTVVRLAQKLGYRGYPELRNDLRRDENTGAERSTLMRGASGHRLEEYIRDETLALRALTDFVTQAELDSAAQTLRSSESVYLLANENEYPTQELLARRFRRLGMVVVSLGTSPQDIAERFSSLGLHSTLVAFAMRDAPKQLPALIAETRLRGGRSIILTDVMGNVFHPAPDHLLAARRGSDDKYRTQIVPIALCYALQLAIFHLDQTRFQAVRDRIEDLSRLLGGTDELPIQP